MHCLLHARFFCSWLLGAVFLVVPSSTWASGFRITNQSIGAVGIAGAHIAFTPTPAASYYNPANMVFLDDQWQAETSLTFLALPAITYQDNRSPMLDGSSDDELFVMPLVHAVSPSYGNLRFGFSLTYPFGLAKQWEQPFPRASAGRFSLLVVEANPSLAYAMQPWLSVGGGVRVLYSEGEVESELTNPPLGQITPLTRLSRSSEGSDSALGYNLALTLKPADAWSIAATYRSENTLKLDGTTTLQAMMDQWALAAYSGDGSLEVTLPAVFSLRLASTFDKLTVELVWDRTFWSSFKELDFQFPASFAGTPFAGFDQAITKNWEDTDAYRLGLTYAWNDAWTTTLGFAYDQTPVPAATLGFELPDSNAFVYCAGLRYRSSPAMEWGISYMYHHTVSRSVANAGAAGLTGVDGTFTDGGAHAITVGLITKF